MGNIVLLDDLTINKIAAGEVIERPASVIKEMVENSIDAGANNITVEIRNGGISFIKITDNGKGIAPDDLEIAFERHATSKIRCADDLNLVTSMGFRGEALASIAAIANVEMITKTKKQETGYKIIVEGGKILYKQEVGCQTGTSIIVRNLFFNTPVRYKFLKKDYTEGGYVEDVITRIALVNPDLAIKLISSGKTVIQTNGNGDIRSVIYSIFGKDVAKGIVPLEYDYDDIKISGVIGKPEIARSNRANQLFFVNKRFVKDKTVASATEQAFKGIIPIGKYGFVVLNIEMNPSKVDVNVHPAKLEVRFEEESKIFHAIYHAIKDTLLKNELVADTSNYDNSELNTSKGLYDFRKNEEKKIEEYNDEESKIKTNVINDIKSEIVDPTSVIEKLKKIREDLQAKLEGEQKYDEKIQEEVVPEENKKEESDENNNEIIEESELEEKEYNEENVAEEVQEEKIEDNENIEEYNEENILDIIQNSDTEKKLEVIKEQIKELEDSNKEQTSENFNEMYEKLFGTKIYDEEEEKTDIEKDNISLFEQTDEYGKPSYKFIGIVFRTYILLEIDKEMYILDQHAAHERIMYEKVKKNYYSDSSKDSQMLLLPDIVSLTHKEMDIAKDNMDLFEKAGFSLEEFGENTIRITGVPTVCLNLDNRELFLETLDEINSVARTAKQEKEEKFIATVACKAAVKANMDLNEEEVDKLMESLLKLPNPFTCPHGRPTAIKMTKYEIERKFARK